MSNGPILLIGANGQVGREALPLLRALGDVVSLTRAELDLTDSVAIRTVVRNVKPRWIVNAAAYTTSHCGGPPTTSAPELLQPTPMRSGPPSSPLSKSNSA